MSKTNDREIIVRIKAGEIDSFSLIVKKYTDLILNYVLKKIHTREDAEDIVQNSFLHFYKAIQRFDEDRPVLPYLYQITKNEMKMFWRSHKKTLPLDERIVAEEKEDNMDLDFLKKQLAKLNEEQKKAIQLISEGFSYREISRFLGRPINTIRTIIRRARLKLTGQNKKNEKT